MVGKALVNGVPWAALAGGLCPRPLWDEPLWPLGGTLEEKNNNNLKKKMFFHFLGRAAIGGKAI